MEYYFSLLEIPSGGIVTIDHILEKFQFSSTNVKMFHNLVNEIFPEESKNINVLHLIDGLLRGLDVNYENDKW